MLRVVYMTFISVEKYMHIWMLKVVWYLPPPNFCNESSVLRNTYIFECWRLYDITSAQRMQWVLSVEKYIHIWMLKVVWHYLHPTYAMNPQCWEIHASLNLCWSEIWLNLNNILTYGKIHLEAFSLMQQQISCEVYQSIGGILNFLKSIS